MTAPRAMARLRALIRPLMTAAAPTSSRSVTVEAADQFAGNHGGARADLAFPVRTARDGKRAADIAITLHRCR